MKAPQIEADKALEKVAQIESLEHAARLLTAEIGRTYILLEVPEYNTKKREKYLSDQKASLEKVVDKLIDLRLNF